MYAREGDWLVVERADIDHDARRGLILEVGSPDGSPPYRVRWVDTGHEALVFPGADAHVLSPAELAEYNARRSARLNRVQAEIRGAAS